MNPNVKPYKPLQLAAWERIYLGWYWAIETFREWLYLINPATDPGESWEFYMCLNIDYHLTLETSYIEAGK
jgi:hypothetical protein